MTVMYKSPVACTENNQYLYMGKEAMSWRVSVFVNHYF